MISNAAAVVGVIIALFLAIGAAVWVVSKASLTTNTIAVLEKNAEAQEKRAIEAERENTLLHERISALETQVANLAELASGTKAIRELGAQLSGYHTELMSAIKQGAPR